MELINAKLRALRRAYVTEHNSLKRESIAREISNMQKRKALQSASMFRLESAMSKFKNL